ncbi:IS3 family transposase [Rhodocytophaga aerolata]|uniref:IS3 family transposase n=1 Tax=Rhodocytophaga aerolata TaxID=455078 RepID=A0ABT8RIR8_9BACT|nr:IS3 family transposase [Rhodocytophaga aerolata]MDO1452002.1 IS3 family transposase [Rhodocytophaga aerolata]
MGLNQLKAMIDTKSELSVRAQCELLGLHRSVLYYQAVAETEENLRIMRLLDERYLSYPTEGVLQMQDYLRRQGFSINHKRVRRLLRKMGIMAIFPKPNLSKLGKAEYIYPYLLKNLPITESNQVWQIDITYIPMAKGFMYLVAMIDVYSRFVVGWDISNNMDSDWVVETLHAALIRHGKPHIVNSDQGSQFTCKKWVEYLKEQQILISMDGKGRAIDNVYIERLWRTVKYDYIYICPAEDGWQLYQGLKAFFERYNYQKCHQGIGRQLPVSVYLGALASSA